MAASWDGMTGKDDAGAGGDPGGTGGNPASPVVKYEFPVEISLVGELDDATVARVAELVFAKLDRELSSRL